METPPSHSLTWAGSVFPLSWEEPQGGGSRAREGGAAADPCPLLGTVEQAEGWRGRPGGAGRRRSGVGWHLGGGAAAGWAGWDACGGGPRAPGSSPPVRWSAGGRSELCGAGRASCRLRPERSAAMPGP
ncbi:hypothetical protein NN561_016192 [Cricetulus griseus]